MRLVVLAFGIAGVVVAGCDGGSAGVDGGRADAAGLDAGAGGDADTGASTDTGADADTGARADTGAGVDTGVGGAADTGATADAAGLDALVALDSGLDALVSADSGLDALVSADTGFDAFVSVDSGHDAFVSVDVGRDTPASGGCVSGAVGTRAVRFRWRGSGAGSTAYVDYELNQLPDTSRWHVSAASMSIGYTPIFDDIFLGEGGLDLEGTAFIDVQLSTLGLPSVSSATIAIYGRSFNTTASGSFRWQTFHGTGSAPTNLVANSAPYEWYLADATAQLPAGDSGALLRIYPGPSSGALIVDRVEICFAE